MLTPGNKKLGGRLIWSFGLPSGGPDVCTGMSDECRRHCYARQVERLRPAVLARYEKNLRLSRLADFAQRVRYFILGHEIAVVRLHSGGDFYAAAYARKWLRVMRGLPDVRFFFYTRAWRDAANLPVLERMARLPNCRAWYSCDRGTGVPPCVPPRVRLAWLMTDVNDLPSPNAALAFRVRPLRRQARTRVNGVRVCPEEDGVARKARVTCDRCGLCWRPLADAAPRRIPLPLVVPSPTDGVNRQPNPAAPPGKGACADADRSPLPKKGATTMTPSTVPPRRFEFSEGNSHKFWEILARGAEVTVRFGRIGAEGRVRAQSFADEQAAAKYVETMVRAKQNKGYREVA